MDKIALEYLSPPENAFWRWQENGEVIEWVDGTTITFRLELLPLLHSMAPRGLPHSLGAVLLVLAATRDTWRESSLGPGILAGILTNCGKPDFASVILTQVLAKLNRVNQLEAELRTSLEAKVVLCETIFADKVQTTSPEVARRIVEQLRMGLGEELAQRQDSPSSPKIGASVLLEDLRGLERSLELLDPEQLKLRRKTGIDQLPQPAEIELPLAQSVRALLKELMQDDELGGLARLALNLMAAVTMPRAVVDREEMQVGGVSDISNRGPLDCLLLSELAHDDLTLAVRVAMNEAMYLRRESPPRTPPRQRTVLLEAGLRSWGVPRVFSTAVALAMAATTDSNVELFVRRAKQDEVKPVDLTTRAGLVEHLAALEPDLHPGSALAAFESEIATAANPAEPLLVVSEEVLEDAHFRAQLHECELVPLHVATVNREGRFRLFERSLRGSKLLREATLDLDSLFAEPVRREVELIDRNVDRDLPAIFACERFPLLLSHQLDQKRLVCFQGRGVMTLTTDGRLMFWNARQQGAVQISDRVPSGALWWSSRNALDERNYAVVGHLSLGGLHLLHIDLAQCHCDSEPLEVDRGVRAICDHRGVIFAIFQNYVQVVDPLTRQVIQKLDLPAGISWRRGRFFQKNAPGIWYALSYDGRTALLEPVITKQNYHSPPLTTLFERDGIDGPIGITYQGDLYLTATDTVRNVYYEGKGVPLINDVSPDGKQVALDFSKSGSGSRQSHRILNTDTLDTSRCYNPDYWKIDPELVPLISPVNLRHRFTHICLDDEGRLALYTRKNHLFSIKYSSQIDQIILDRLTSPKPALRRSFTSFKSQTKFGFVLSQATWEDGSVAVLDTRGLIHLKSSDRSIPECTIVLSDTELAGWCSDGRLWGGRYFIGRDRDSASKKQVYESAIQAFAGRLR